MTARAVPGDELGRVTFPVELGKVRELARSLFDDAAIYYDADAARAAGFEAVPAPLTYSVVLAHWAEGDDEQLMQEQFGVDIGRILHGEASWEYLRPVLVGDELTAVERLADITTRAGRRGGTMTVFTTETEITNQRGELVILRRDKLIETGDD